MLSLIMSSWVSLTMGLILFLTLTFNDITKAQEAKLIGAVYCDTCFQQYFSPSSHFISGALVAVECGGDEIEVSGGRPRFQEEVKTDVKGKFSVILPFSATKQVNMIKRCSVRLISSSEPDCAVAAISTATSSSIRLKVKTSKNHVFSAGYFTFQPLEQPKRCQWESHANANDEIIASSPLPSPAADGMLAPIPPLTDWNEWNPVGRELHDLGDENNLRSSDPFSQNLPPLLVPSFPSQHPPRSIFVPVVPPPPDTMLNAAFQPPPDSMHNTGFQPPPDTRFNTGFQPPPDSMLNTGFQPPPPPDSVFNTGFQPPPDTRSDTGFQPPPDSMLNTGSQPPPDSMINAGFQTPPPDSMINIGFQPPPDSMLNTGVQQPPPDSMLNTGFQQSPPNSMPNTGFQQPPPDSMLNTGFQPPPPDSMFNPNPLQPPSDSTVDPSQPSPPSLIPQLLTPPPPPSSPPPPTPSLSLSLPSPPLNPQPDLTQATPPPPFNPPFPAFPFQPSVGLPRMPPRTKIPPLLYK